MMIRRNRRVPRRFLLVLLVPVLPVAAPALAQQPNLQQAGKQPQQVPDPQSPGSISGTVVDATGAVVAGALVALAREGQSPSQQVLSDGDGQFTFANISPGSFHVTITLHGFATETSSGILHAGEMCIVRQITLAVAPAIAEVQVVLPRIQLAEAEVQEEEKQRVFGVIPNFYVSYAPDATRLSSKQKFELAWKTSVDPVTFGIIGAVAGIQQAQNDFRGYGQGAQGYGKRYGAAYANWISSTFIGSAILPSLLKQDPRYFYKGSGSRRSRILYAIANSVICKGDNGHWQANYSNILGGFAAGGISNLYYPAADRNGVELTLDSGLISIGAASATNLLEEFLIRKLTPNLPNREAPNPESGD